jgi:cullin-associated NEDD8-dissociated protein 1
MVQNDAGKRLLSLHSLKEVRAVDLLRAYYLTISSQVVTHCSHVQLESFAEALWTPLFENSENSEEITRNVAAACLGKLSTTNPSKYLPQLHVGGSVTAALTF